MAKLKLSSLPDDQSLANLLQQIADVVVVRDTTGRINGTGISIGEPNKEGSFRIIPLDGTLSVQKYEGGQWVEKGSF